MAYKQEFETVDLILQSAAETRGVDAFALSLIKAERQVRKLFTHLIYQFPCFGPKDIQQLRETLGSNRQVYFKGFLRGFDLLYPRSVSDLIGPSYSQRFDRLNEAIEHRNKIFHGQLTSKSLTRADLLGYVQDIRDWCGKFAEGAMAEFRYDGFARNSFQKSPIADIWKGFRVQIHDLNAYASFIRQHMQ